MKQVILGVSVIAFGVILLLANLGVYNIQELVQMWWPVGLVVAGGLLLLNERTSYGWSIALSLLGLFFLARNMEIITISFAQIFWPGVIIAIGLSLLLRDGRSSPRVSTEVEDEVVSVLSGVEYNNTSRDYKGGKITAILGGAAVDIFNARIKKEATITVFTLMGGVEVRVPRNVIVKTRTVSILGGIEDSHASQQVADSPVLYIEGTVILGGVEIKRS